MSSSCRDTSLGTGSAPVGPSVWVEGRAIPVVHSYPASQWLQLHSLAELTEYQCTACQCRQESAMVALDGADPVCPGCFARLTIPDSRRPG